MSRRSSLCSRVHAALIAVAAALVVAAPAEAQAVIGGQLFATGGTVDIVVQPGTAAFRSRLFLQGPDGTPNNIALNTEVGKHVTVGPFPAGRELVFGITCSTAARRSSWAQRAGTRTASHTPTLRRPACARS
jgi:hypothetical protein